MIPVKTAEEIKIMRQAGQILAEIMRKIIFKTRENVSTLELDQLAEKLILKAGAKPAFKNYKHKDRIYPATLCTSINNQLVHTEPKKEQIIKNRDIISIDCGLNYNGYFADMAVTVPIGKVSAEAKKLIKTTKNSLDLVIRIIKPGIHLGDISSTIQSYVEKRGFSVVRQLSGHGIGKELHEDPTILNYGKSGTGPILRTGMTLAIEPMVNAGHWKVKTLDDGWAVVTADDSLSAHFEHTILVTKKGAEILTNI
ncbi:type I methionyl aminopeptidase [Patescibacteria group bacterium]|nr:type I methionyl aminopeptidase [Patescibacteria group bacterium]